MKIICPQCQKEAELKIGAVNYALKKGRNIYCSRDCSSEARRKTIEEKKAVKAEYDRKHRENNRERLKKEKADYFKRTYDPVAAAIARKKRMPYHVEFCRKPEQKAKKKIYDRIHRAKKQYGEYWESALIVAELDEIIDDKEVRQDNNLHNKSQKRKRTWQQKQKTNSVPRI